MDTEELHVTVECVMCVQVFRRAAVELHSTTGNIKHVHRVKKVVEKKIVLFFVENKPGMAARASYFGTFFFDNILTIFAFILSLNGGEMRRMLPKSYFVQDITESENRFKRTCTHDTEYNIITPTCCIV